MSSTTSVSPHFAAPTRNESAEDCRDYLRTGRCKYGSSCKYNHPSNVQSGGGMKAPLDPSEPLFPVRPNEPLCQYYMKHGNCKFGQACKFNHPPQASMQPGMNGSAGGTGGGTPLVNLGRKPDSPQLVMNPVATDAGGSSMMVQFLPQRPDEPDCIYFLKNGRCKYGATCRYHHPVNYNAAMRVEEQPTRRQLSTNQEVYPTHKVQFVGQSINGLPQGHVIISENAGMTFINVDSNGAKSFQPVSVVGGTDGITPFCAPAGSGLVTEQGSSSSSIASSFETATSSLEYMPFNAESAMWSRAKRNGSGNSLSAYAETASVVSSNAATNHRPQQRILAHSASEGNIAQQRRTRAASYGSAADHTNYYEASSLNGNNSMNRSTGPPITWRQDRSVSFDHTRRHPPSHYVVRQQHQEAMEPQMESRPQSHLHPHHHSQQHQRTRPPVAGGPRGNMRRNQRSGEGDEGFTMMTSALLTMLDTPEEAAQHGFDEGEAEDHNTTYNVDPAMFERLALGTRYTTTTSEPPNHHHHEQEGANSLSVASWSPSWSPGQQDSGDRGNRGHIPNMQPRLPRTHFPPPHQDSDVGMYLP